MTLIKFKNESPVRHRERMPLWSDFFNDLFDDVITKPDVRRSTIPSVNVVESDENYRLEVAAPGLNKDDFKISVDNDVMTVSTEKKSETTEKNEKYTRQEFSYSAFTRSFTLPEMVDVDKIQASYESGIMRIILPKKEEAKPKAPREIKVG